MASDLQVPAISSGLTIPIGPLLDDNYMPDDLSAYTTIRLVIEDFDHTANVLNKTQADAEVEISAEPGFINWTPTDANKTPVAGFYWLQVIREGAAPVISKPSKRYFLEVTQEVRKV